MIDLVNLGEYSIFTVELGEDEDELTNYCLYSHIVDEYKGYGWIFKTELDLYKFYENAMNGVINYHGDRILFRFDNKTIIFPDIDSNDYAIDDLDKKSLIKIIHESKREPNRYVSFEFNLLEQINEGKYDIWHDYMNYGFQQVEDSERQYMFDDGEYAELFGNGESLWINEKDYNTITSSMQSRSFKKR